MRDEALRPCSADAGGTNHSMTGGRDGTHSRRNCSNCPLGKVKLGQRLRGLQSHVESHFCSTHRRAGHDVIEEPHVSNMGRPLNWLKTPRSEDFPLHRGSMPI